MRQGDAWSPPVRRSQLAPLPASPPPPPPPPRLIERGHGLAPPPDAHTAPPPHGGVARVRGHAAPASVSHNALSGEIPRAVRSPLLHLDLQSNRLSGRVSSLPGTLVYLLLTGNRLSGPVGAALRLLPRLSFLDLGRN